MRTSEPVLPKTPGEALERYVSTLRRWWPLAAAIVLVAMLTAVVVAMGRPKSYEATAKVLLGQQRQVEMVLGTGDYSPDPERELNTSVQLITLEPIADGVRRALGLRESPAALVARVTTAVDHNSNLVAITVSDGDAERAATIANAFAAGYREYRASSARAAVEDAIASARARMAGLESEPDRRALGAELTRLEVAQALQTGGVQVVHEATAESATSHPRPVRAGLLGGLVGTMAAALTIIVLARTDRRVSGDGDLEQVTGRRVVAHIRRSRPAAADAMMTLALSIARGGVGHSPAGVLLLTSAGPDEGAPEVAVGLARALGAVGLKTVAIEADFRRPSFSEMLRLTEDGGLTAVLAGRRQLESELVAVGPEAAVLPAGATAELPQALLAGERMAATVEEACGRSDVVLLAASPVGRYGDAVALAGVVHEAFLVARVDVTRPDELGRAVAALTDAGIPPAGVISTERPARRPLAAVLTAYRRHAPERGTKRSSSTSEVTVG
jgi:succinoglycan biosynthesis transport protein ExoP